MTRVWLIRHGESESNIGRTSAEPAMIPLTEFGRQQAQQVTLAFARPPALIVTSPYLRARQTAQPTVERFPDVPYEQWPVQEFTYLGELHGKATTAKEREPFVRAYWDRGDPGFALGGAESFNDLRGRVQDLLDRLSQTPKGPVAVFTHGHFMRAMVWTVLSGGSMQDFRRFAESYIVPNCGVIELRFPGPRLIGAARLNPLW
ncbi:broad specificity phosphatase PhoE [Kibdelosporangium banguiense]|uniref:Broad specificity phosphatase PhoE n=1 Tax=Kibdelosporangium banguiense TaxID=1365924 RepID=A0ABS4TJZ2_9PSEU|nr:histidine phosphatase family protein [Kibdelosporangium banguiense]MBP2324176.1 broad specificity phosphatase PhoE [Kibdelosporangium banguiense]